MQLHLHLFYLFFMNILISNYLQNITLRHPQSGTEMDTTWKKEARTAKDDVATNSNGRAERDGAIVE